jgi:predicted transcriptional regulator
MHRIETTTITLERPGAKPQVFNVSSATAKHVEMLVKVSRNGRKSVPAEVALPELADDVLRPACVLRGFRYREQLTQIQLAKRLGIRQSHLSEMENAKRPIGKEMARRLAEVLKCNYKVFL